jgi:SAM-dependent methyltransferase
MTRMTPAPQRRWDEVLATLAALVPPGPAAVLVDGTGAHPALLADRLAAALRAGERPCTRLAGTSRLEGAGPALVLAAGSGLRDSGPWDLVIWLRTPPDPGPGADGPGADGPGRDGEAGADIVVDLHDPAWPVIRHVAAPLARDTGWYIRETQAFFALRAATWDRKFGTDLPAYAAAIAEAGLPRGGVVADVGCGTGRALAALRDAVGPRGAVLAFDLTLEMLAEARGAGGRARAALVAADARRLPLGGATVDAVFTAGLINHLPDAGTGLAELARISRPGGRLVLFHPSGRAALAARHGRPLQPDEPLSPGPLRDAMDQAGWCLDRYDDAPVRFLAVATRGPAVPGPAAS